MLLLDDGCSPRNDEGHVIAREIPRGLSFFLGQKPETIFIGVMLLMKDCFGAVRHRE
jgi:hypothetical protein